MTGTDSDNLAPTTLDPTGVVPLLAGSVLGIYLLVVLGAVTSLLDGVVACPTWPVCTNPLHWSVTDPGVLVALTHRLAAVIVGVLLLATLHRSLDHATQRVRYALATATVLYPIELLSGALTATTGTTVLIQAAHLVVAMVIFSVVLAALVWHLETQTTHPTTADHQDTVDPVTTPASDTTPEHGESTRSLRAVVGDYLELMKPKLMWLLCLVALATMGLAAGPTLSIGTVVATLGGGVLAIGASGTFNNILERDRDRRMQRTDDRPLVTNRIPLTNAIVFGLTLTIASVTVFVVWVNVLAATLGLLAILFYSIGYTLLLKPHTTHNIVIGGAVGAFPALIGWAAVTNTIGIPALVVGTVIFLWTPAHFYNLALAYREDYERGGFPMLPVVSDAATTRRHILLYLGATMLAAVILGAITRLGILYATTSIVVGAVFLWAIITQYEERTEAAALRTFHASNAYLGLLLAAITLDTLLV